MAITESEFQKQWAFLADKKLFVACSGGADSVVLTHLAKSFCKEITLLHVNYNLRGEESIEDELFVRKYAEDNKLKLEVKSVQTKILLEEKKQNLQALAREIRYEWFSKFLKEENTVLLLGHHFDDQIETFYLNLARKAGILGLSCMLEQSEKVCRPLLNFEKKDIYTFAKEQQLSWREDSSNQKNDYRRNRLRNEILPFLEGQIPDLKNSVKILIEAFQEERKMLEESLGELRKELQNYNKLDFVTWKNLIRRSGDTLGLILLKPYSFTQNQLAEIDKLLTSQKGAKVLSATHELIREEDYFFLKTRQQTATLPKLLISEVASLPKVFTKDCIYLDKQKIKGELRLRFWQEGDRIASIGVRGTQLVSDIITDAKIQHHLRDAVLVLHDEANIHWVVGLKIGRLAVASEVTKKNVRVSIEKY